MKILVLSKGNVPSKAANSIQVHKMTKAFSEIGHQTSLLTRFNTSRKSILSELGGEGISYITALLFSHTKINFLFRIINLFIIFFVIMRTRPDIIFTRSLTDLAFCPNKRPIIFETHSMELSKKDLKILKNKNVVKVITISRVLADRLSSKYGITADVFHDASEEVQVMAVNELEKRVCFTGHLYENRGIDQLIRVANRLPHVFFEIYGGTEEDLRKWRQIPISSNLKFHGYVSPVLIKDIQAQSLILIINYSQKLNTAAYCSPLKLNEYIATGNIVIGTDFGPIMSEYSDYIQLVAADNDDQLVGIIDHIWHNWETYLKNSRKIYNKKGIPTWKQRAIDILSSV